MLNYWWFCLLAVVTGHAETAPSHAPAPVALAEVRGSAAGGPRALVACTGNSTLLPADQCTAFQAFWDGASGARWTRYGAGCPRTDPCALSCRVGLNTGAGVCNTARTSVTSMCAPLPPPPPTPRALGPPRLSCATAHCCHALLLPLLLILPPPTPSPLRAAT